MFFAHLSDVFEAEVGPDGVFLVQLHYFHLLGALFRVFLENLGRVVLQVVVSIRAPTPSPLGD